VVTVRAQMKRCTRSDIADERVAADS